MFERSTDKMYRLLTWLFDKTGQFLLWIVMKASKSDTSHLTKYRKAFGFLIWAAIVAVVYLVKQVSK